MSWRSQGRRRDQCEARRSLASPLPGGGRVPPSHQREGISPTGVMAARRYFTVALAAHGQPDKVVADGVRALERVIEELTSAVLHNSGTYAIVSSMTTAGSRLACGRGEGRRPTGRQS